MDRLIRTFTELTHSRLSGVLVFLVLAGVFMSQSAMAHSQADQPNQASARQSNDGESLPNQDQAPCHEGTHTGTPPSAPGCHSAHCSAPALLTSLPQITLIPDGYSFGFSNDGLPSSPYPRRLNRPPSA